SRTVDSPQRPMLGQRVPGREGQILAGLLLLGRVERLGRDAGIIATFCQEASHGTVGSSTGMAMGSPRAWTDKSKRAAPVARWAAMANRRRSGESIAGVGGVSARSGAAMYFTAEGPSLEGVVLQ